MARISAPLALLLTVVRNALTQKVGAHDHHQILANLIRLRRGNDHSQKLDHHADDGDPEFLD